MINEFHLLRPYWLLALIPLFILLWWLWRQKYNSKSWQAVCDPRLLPYILIGSESQRKKWPFIIMALTGILVIFALAGPVWEKLEQPVFREQSALVIILDLSRSMDATDIKPSRLTRAKHKIIDTLKQRKEGQTALVVYAEDAYTVSPLTQDADTIMSLVKTLSTDLMPTQGSDPDKALKHAESLLTQAGIHSGSLLLITDGINNSQIQEIQSLLSGNKHTLSVLGVGTPQGAPISSPGGGFLKDSSGDIIMPKLDSSTLQQLAEIGGGRYHTLTTDDRDLAYLLETIKAKQINANLEETDFLADRWKEEGPWLLLLVLPMAALAFRRGYLIVLVIFCLPVIPEPANAFEWDSLWQRDDQRAAEQLKTQDNQKPLPSPELFKDPEWQAAANYRAGNYQQTIEALEGLKTTDALYNKGNALAKAGNLPDAIKAYDQALEQDPAHEDAKYNRDLVKKKLEEQQQSSDRKKDGDQQKDNKDQKESGQDQSSDSQSSDEQSSENNKNEQDQAQSDKDDNSAEHEQASSEQKENKDNDKEEEMKQNESKSAQQEKDNESQKEEEKSPTESEVQEENEQTETQQANEQWLRRIPDDPGGLLRRKFQYEHQRRLQQQRANGQATDSINGGTQKW